MNLRTPWSQTRFQSSLKLVGFCASQVIAVEAVAGWLLKSVEIRCFHSYKIAYIAGANKGSACLSAIFLPEVAFHRRVPDRGYLPSPTSRSWRAQELQGGPPRSWQSLFARGSSPSHRLNHSRLVDRIAIRRQLHNPSPDRAISKARQQS